MKNTEAAFKYIINILQKHNIPFRLAGGFSAKLYGSDRELADIDIELPEDRFEELLPEIKSFIQFGPDQYIDEEWNLKLITLDYEGQLIDLAGAYETKIFNKNTNLWENLVSDFSKSVMMDVYGMTVPVIPKEDLIAYKSKIQREVDKLDVIALTK